MAYLPLALTIFVSAGAASALVQRLGVRPVLVTGLLLTAGGLLLFSRVSAGGSYTGDVLVPSLLVAVGLGFSFVPVTIAAVAGVKAHEAGLASGLINTSQQVGGALGLAILSTLATQRSQDVAATGADPTTALVEGFQRAFAVGAGFAIAGAIVAAIAVRPPRIPAGEAVPVAA